MEQSFLNTLVSSHVQFVSLEVSAGGENWCLFDQTSSSHHRLSGSVSSESMESDVPPFLGCFFMFVCCSIANKNQQGTVNEKISITLKEKNIY